MPLPKPEYYYYRCPLCKEGHRVDGSSSPGAAEDMISLGFDPVEVIMEFVEKGLNRKFFEAHPETKLSFDPALIFIQENT